MGALPRLPKTPAMGQLKIGLPRPGVMQLLPPLRSQLPAPRFQVRGPSRLIMFTPSIYVNYSVDTVYVIRYKIAVFRTLPCSPARQVNFSGVLSDVFVE
jgi:hypothetical protein